MNSRVRIYVFATWLAAVAASTAVFIRAPGVDWNAIRAGLSLGAIALLAQLLRYTLNRNVGGTVSFVPSLALAAVAPTWTAVAVIFVVTAIVQAPRDYGFIKKAFNVGQQCFAIAAGILVYQLAGGEPMTEHSTTAYAAMFALFATFTMANNGLVTGVVALSESRHFREVWSKNSWQPVAYDLLSFPLIVGLAWVYVHYGIAGAFILATPLLGVRQLYKVNSDLEQANQELLELMVAAIEARDPYTSGHSRRVSQNAKIIAQILGLRGSVVKRVEVAALLHDVGKIHEVFAPILQKPGRLTEEEHAIMQTHPIKSEELVSKVSQLQDIVPAVRHHHENWNGTGYPDGLAGEKIPLASRIIIFADTIDAMTSDRPYRKALDATAVREELVKHRGRQFDPEICDTLLSSPRYKELFKHAGHTSLSHTQEVPRLRLAGNS
jgi:HD superfamily phosphohydrolase YqeK